MGSLAKRSDWGELRDGSVSTATSVVRGPVGAKSWILCVVSDFDGRLHVMKTSSKLAGSLCAVALALTPVLASAANLTLSAILSSTQSNDGQAVTVDGKVKEFILRNKLADLARSRCTKSAISNALMLSIGAVVHRQTTVPSPFVEPFIHRSRHRIRRLRTLS